MYVVVFPFVNETKLNYILSLYENAKKNSLLMLNVQSDQQENKSRVLPHLLFYRNVSLSLIIHDVCILAIQSCYWLPTSRKLYY
jgi:hypothetical protein